jgi:hypothetical protein
MVDFSPFIRRRRQSLAELDGGMFVAFAAAPTIRSNDVCEGLVALGVVPRDPADFERACRG